MLGPHYIANITFVMFVIGAYVQPSRGYVEYMQASKQYEHAPPSAPALGVPSDDMTHVLMQAAQTPLPWEDIVMECDWVNTVPKEANTPHKYRVAVVAHRACVYLTRLLVTLALMFIICILIAWGGQCTPV